MQLLLGRLCSFLVLTSWTEAYEVWALLIVLILTTNYSIPSLGNVVR